MDTNKLVIAIFLYCLLLYFLKIDIINILFILIVTIVTVFIYYINLCKGKVDLPQENKHINQNVILEKKPVNENGNESKNRNESKNGNDSKNRNENEIKITTDNEFNVFPKFNKEILSNKDKNKNISVIKKSKNKEHFTNILDLNDVREPYNSTVINPYEEYSFLTDKKVDSEKDIYSDVLCFHCKTGICETGICKPKINIEPSNFNLSDLPSYLNIHPYSDDQATIRVSNPDLAG